LAEQGFIYKIELPPAIDPFTLDDLNMWLLEYGLRPKVDYVMSSWAYYFKDEKMAFLFGLTFGGRSKL
jgi:hypothetical protein